MSNSVRRRQGLAPVEMTLVLPILMMIMAVIIVFGYASSWKLRTETVARDVVWRSRLPRFSNRDTRAPEWPEPATMSVGSDENLQDLDGEPVLDDPIIAGPLPQITVNDDLLDFTRGVNMGIAHVDRPPPIFATLTSLDFRVDHPILYDLFHHRQMGIGNVARRIPLIYEIGLDFILESAAIRAAVFALTNSPYKSALQPLDNDAELIANDWYRDFYPRLRVRDRDRTWPPLMRDIRSAVNRTIGAVRRVPFSMGGHWVAMYTEMQQESESESEREQLQQLIDELNEWMQNLRSSRGG